MNTTQLTPQNIEQFFCEITGIQAENESLLPVLYEIYCAECESAISYSDFEGFGKILLSDFDEIDRNLVDVEALFRTIAELKEKNDFSYLNAHHIANIKRFFDFDETHNTKIYSNLFGIYEKFRNELLQTNRAYQGMLQRMAALDEKYLALIRENHKYEVKHFFSFNEAVKSVVNNLKNYDKVDFLWDFKAADGYIEHFGGKIDPNINRNALSDGINAPKYFERHFTMEKCAHSFEQTIIARDLIKKIIMDGASPVGVVLCDERLRTFIGNMDGNEFEVMLFEETEGKIFENLIILSADSTNLPKVALNTLIPQEVRKAFALKTVQGQEEEQKYLFERLVYHAKHIHFLYCGEPSAELLQLEYANDYNMENVLRKPNIIIENTAQQLEVAKTARILEKLRWKYSIKPLSPSAFNNYIECPLRFYFKYVAELQNPEPTELDNAMLGKIFHKCMELVYKGRKIITEDIFNSINIDKIIEAAFNSVYFRDEMPRTQAEFRGEELIFAKVIARMLKNTLEYDAKNAPFEIIGLETKVEFLKNGLKIGGIIDRIDRIIRQDSIVEEIRILDYKTGKVASPKDFAEEISELFSTNRPKKAGYQFQTYLYSLIFADESLVSKKISPNLLFVLQSNIDERRVDDFWSIRDAFAARFFEKLDELFDLEVGFTQCENVDNCIYCDYSNICSR